MNKQFNFHFQSSKPLNINKTNEITISSKETKTIKKIIVNTISKLFW